MSSNVPTITVAIATLDRYPYVETLLGDLAKQTRLPDEVLIVDQTTPASRQTLPTHKWKHAFPLRTIVQNAKGTTKARNCLLRECRSDVILMPDDDVRLGSDYVANHLRHFADNRIDVVSGPVYELDLARNGWFVKWETHFMLEGPTGRAFMSVRSFSGTNSSMLVASALAIGGWDENIVTYGEDNDFQERLDRAGAVCMFDPQAGLRHLRAPRGGERDTKWGNIGPEANWHVLAGFFYFFLANRPPYSVFKTMRNYVLAPFAHMRHGRVIGLKLLPHVLIALPVSLWRWSRGPLLLDREAPNQNVRRFSKAFIYPDAGKLARRYLDGRSSEVTRPRAFHSQAEEPKLTSSHHGD